MGSGNGDICRVLLAAGADAHARTHTAGLTPLHIAAIENCLDCAAQLLAAGADALSTDTYGATAAAIARRHHNYKQFAALLDDAATAARWRGLRRVALTAWVLT